MTYATIAEAWGGLSGSSMNQLQMHPSHQKEIKRRKKRPYENIQNYPNGPNGGPPSYKTTNDLYQCEYGTGPGGMYNQNCNEILERNHNFNEQQKRIAEGIQQLPQGSIQWKPGYGYVLLPQYPWQEWAKFNYLSYPQNLSQQFYNNPYQSHPNVANEIQEYQNMYNIKPIPQQYNLVEHFGTHNNNHNNNNNINPKTLILIFIFFLIALSVILCLFLIIFANMNSKK
jgi:hypothetical protein